MKRARSNHWVFALFWTCTVIAGVVGYFFWEAWNDAQRQLASLERRHADVEEAGLQEQRRKDNNREYLNRVQHDAEFFMNEVRQRLGYAVPGEFIIKVEPPPRPGNPSARQAPVRR